MSDKIGIEVPITVNQPRSSRAVMKQALAIVFSSIMLGPVSPASGVTWPYKLGHVNCSVQTPRALFVALRKGADFDLYDFSIQQRAVLHAYIGNNPRFPTFRGLKVRSSNHTSINGLVAKTIVYATLAGTKARETLLESDQPPPWDRYIEFLLRERLNE